MVESPAVSQQKGISVEKQVIWIKLHCLMTQDTVQAKPAKRKRFRFGLRSLFFLTFICCLVVFAMKWHHEASLAKKKQWLLSHGGGNAVLLEDGDVVLVRQGESCGAFIVKSQSIQPERMEYDWYYRSDGNGMLFRGDAAVSTGSGRSGSPTPTINIHFGSFELQWSGGDRGFGWFYYPNDPAVEFGVMRNRQLRNIDANSERWQFKSGKDKPPMAPPPWAELADQDAK